MKLNQKIFRNRKVLSIAILLATAIFLWISPKTSSVVNKIVETSFYKLSGEQTVDTNIVIIKISDKDITALGGWPLKRSYYALLISKLNELEVSKIGLEVYLSDNNSSQEIYNELIINEIKGKNNVVLSAIVNNLENNLDDYSATILLKPKFAQEFENIKIGHINFVEDNGFVVPKKIAITKGNVFSFAHVLADDTTDCELKINFHSSFNSFRSYSILEFFAAWENNVSIKSVFKNKIVLIGVTDPTIGKSVYTPFDKLLAGIGLHAFALDNIMNNRGLNDNYFLISQFLFFMLILLVILFFRKNQLYIYGLLFLTIFLFAYILFIHFYVELIYAAFIIPFFFLSIVEVILLFTKKIDERNIAYSENEILQKALFTKENELVILQSELSKTNNPPTELQNRIELLKDEIEEIRLSNEENKIPYKPNSNMQKKDFFGIVYTSEAIEKVVNIIKKVAPTDATVLILGESGSGKELVANAIHQLSKREKKEIVAFNCAAIPDNLLESELFGHVKGAFTDASKDKIGRFEAADNGTIFLDEIGETSERFQAKLLRILQSGEFQKVGSTVTQKVNVRVIAATNKNLQEQVKENKFREDLYYRLNVITIEVPNLDNRKEDIPIIAEYFANQEYSGLQISKSVMDALKENVWIGNVRELESQIMRAAIFAKSENRNIIQLCDIHDSIAKSGRTDLKGLILNSLREKKFSHSAISDTAKELGNISRTIVAENYRGIFFEELVNSNFKFDKAVANIANCEDKEIIEKISKKGTTYLSNIEKDLLKFSVSSFDEIKTKFTSKYKNLPQKYHLYLDAIIKNKNEL